MESGRTPAPKEPDGHKPCPGNIGSLAISPQVTPYLAVGSCPGGRGSSEV